MNSKEKVNFPCFERTRKNRFRSNFLPFLKTLFCPYHRIFLLLSTYSFNIARILSKL